MNPLLNGPRSDLKIAADAIAAMEVSSDFLDFNRHWQDFLWNRHDRCLIRRDMKNTDSLEALCRAVRAYANRHGNEDGLAMTPVPGLRMMRGLTTYLLQSVFLAIVFYGVGFGMMGELGHAAATGIGIVFFVAQVFMARWWLARMSMGPVEWL